MRRNLNYWLLVVTAIALTGCGTLNNTGVYKGDKTLYDADLLITSSYDVIHAFVLYEANNRQELASVPEVKQAADAIRAKAPSAFASAIAIRDVYAQSPNKDTGNALQTSLDVIRAMAVEAAKYMAKTIK